MAQFVKPIWGVQSTVHGYIVGRATLPLAAEAQRWGKRFATMFVTADTEEEARRTVADFECEARGFRKSVTISEHPATGARILIPAPRW